VALTGHHHRESEVALLAFTRRPRHHQPWALQGILGFLGFLGVRVYRV
jgi:hypothetical protein